MLVGLVLGVALLRLWFCAQLPVNTSDLLRSLHTALFTLRDGLGVAGVPLRDLDPELRFVGWSHIAYLYPPLVLPFFTAVAAVSPTLFAGKLALTAVEAVNAVLVGRITGSRWLGALYWASPLSIWWVSGEGQFEPLMAAFMLGAVALVRKRPALALAFLGLGVDVKLTAALLLPWCLVVVRRERPEALGRAMGAFAAAVLAPILVAEGWYGLIEGMLSIPATDRYNPYYWNVLDLTVFRWNPDWLVGVNAVATYGVLALMIVHARRRERGWVELGGAIAFVALVKVSALAQPWYMLLFPAFVMPVHDAPGERGLRWWLVALTPLLDVLSLSQLFVGPWGWLEIEMHRGLTAFTELGIGG